MLYLCTVSFVKFDCVRDSWRQKYNFHKNVHFHLLIKTAFFNLKTFPSQGFVRIGPQFMCRTFHALWVKILGVDCFKLFYKWFKMVENLKVRGHSFKLQSCTAWVDAYGDGSYMAVGQTGPELYMFEFWFSIECYSATIWPMTVSFGYWPFSMTLYHCAKFRACVRDKIIIYLKLQFSLAHKNFIL